VKIIHFDDVTPERLQRAAGWAISEFRLPITGADRSSTTMFHATFRPGSVHDKHVHTRTDEFVAYLNGRGTIGQGPGRAEVTAGFRRWIPRGSEHFFFNESESDVVRLVGFYPEADGLSGTGYEYRGPVGASDVERPLDPPTEGRLVHLDDVPVSAPEWPGWEQLELRISVGEHTNVRHALVDATVPPGRQIPGRLLTGCEQIYYILSGAGSVRTASGSTPVREGHVVFAPVGSDFDLGASEDQGPMVVLGFWTGAGSLAAAHRGLS
jgi:mannose-6-phosphate isomerase-like protein (cupin superfamily)